MTAVAGPLCAMTTNGWHKLRPFHYEAHARLPNEIERSGMACVACGKCWFFEGKDLVPFTHDDVRGRP